MCERCFPLGYSWPHGPSLINSVVCIDYSLVYIWCLLLLFLNFSIVDY